MEESDKNHILRNIDKLIVDTIFSATLKATLLSKKVMGIADIEEVDAEKTNRDKAFKLYMILIKRKDIYDNLLSALQESDQNSTAAYIISQGRDVSSSLCPKDRQVSLSSQRISFNIRLPVQLFTGRNEELQSLQDMIQSYNHEVTQLIAVTGLGGIGKSELCRRFIQKHSELFDSNMIWINAERAESITECFRRLAKDVLLIGTRDANGDEKDIDSIVEETYRYLSDLGKRSVLVFDNVDNLEELNKFLPSQSHPPSISPYVLITSRDREWEFGASVLYLRELKSSEAIDLVKKGLKVEESDELVVELVTKLHGLPLAIQQAIAFINVQRHLDMTFNIQKYIQLFETNSKLVLDTKGPASTFSTYKLTTFTTWKLTTKVIASDLEYGKLALKLLHFIAYLAADNIQKRIILSIGNDFCEMEVMLGLRLLVKYSIVNSEPQSGAVNINRLVQEVTRLQLKNEGKEEELLKQVIELISTNLNGSDYKEIIDHAVYAWTHCQRYQSVFQKYGFLPMQIVEGLSATRRFDEACQFGRACLARQYTGHSHCIHSLCVLYEIGNALMLQGKYKQAIEILEEVREKGIAIVGELHLLVISTENNLGTTCMAQGLFRRSLEMLQSVHLKRRQFYGEDNIYTADVLQNIASTLQNMGYYKDALSTFQECGLKYQALICPKHTGDRPLLLMRNSALVYGYVVNMKEAEQKLRQVHRKRVETLGNNSHSTLSTLLSLQIILYEQGIYDEAYAICEDILEKYKSMLGEEHPDTLQALNSLGRILKGQGKYDRALAIHEDVYAKLTKHFDLDHPNVVLVKRDILIAYGSIGKHNQAVTGLLEILKILENLFGERSYHVVETKVEIACVLSARGDNKLAEDYLIQASKTTTKEFGETSHVGLRIEESIRKIHN